MMFPNQPQQLKLFTLVMTKKEKEELRYFIMNVKLSDDKIEALESLYRYCKNLVKL